MLTPNRKTLVIAAIASRPYVQAAVNAGFDVISIDGFTDEDTKHLAKTTHQVPITKMQLNADEVLAIVSTITPNTVAGFCYGAGFEMQPVLLDNINQHIKVLGNSAKVVMQSKNPRWFFKCCDDVGVPYPKVMLAPPKTIDGWLQKTIGGSGGEHVKILSATQAEVPGNVYFQKHQEGRLISCLFLVDQSGVHIIGFNEQWSESSALAPFRYGGAVSHAELSQVATLRFTAYINQLVSAMHLVGLNSCDAICDGHDVYVLEVNPRLSATIDLYSPNYRGLMAMHVAANCSKLVASAFEQNNQCKASIAHQVIYANCDVTIEHHMDWPDWVRDVPQADNRFKIGMPLCTVMAKAETARLAKSLVHDRAVELSSKLIN